MIKKETKKTSYKVKGGFILNIVIRLDWDFLCHFQGLAKTIYFKGYEKVH